MGNDTTYHQALTLEYEGRYRDALQLFQRCLDDPTFDAGDVHFHCGWCLENERQEDDALRCYGLAAELTRLPSCRINCYFRSGWILMHRKNYETAADMFRHAVDYGDVAHLRDETYGNALFWYAVCLEAQARYIEALRWYRSAQEASHLLDPESRLRQITCLVHIGSYEQALDLCRTFDAPSPPGFDAERYRALQADVRRERTMLEGSLLPSYQQASYAHVSR